MKRLFDVKRVHFDIALVSETAALGGHSPAALARTTTSEGACRTIGRRRRRSHAFVLRAIWMALVVSVAGGCSHVREPYVRPSIACPSSATNDAPADVRAHNANVATRLVLIGDAGEGLQDTSLWHAMRERIGEVPEKTTVVFLGDNIYGAGMPTKRSIGMPKDAARTNAEAQLQAQISLMPTNIARGIFIPGNHDWNQSRPGGVERILAQQTYVQEHKHSFLPPLELPSLESAGIYVTNLNERAPVLLIVLDTELLLFRLKINPHDDLRDVLVPLQKAIRAASGEVVVVAHHPLATHGEHGGFYDWKQWFFPGTTLKSRLWLPIRWVPVPFVYPIGRTIAALTPSQLTKGDLCAPAYWSLKTNLTATLSARPPLAYAAGHDHNLQVLDGGKAAKYILVSGFGSPQKVSSVGHGDDTIFAHRQPGFMIVDFMADKSVLLKVIKTNDEKGTNQAHSKLVFCMPLK